MEGIDGHEDDPCEETDDPGMPRCPELEDELCGGEIGGDGYGVVEPVVPRERESVGRGEEAGRVGVERAWKG